MFTFTVFRRQNDRPRNQRRQARHPQVEVLDGRLLLSGLTVTSDIVGAHPGTPQAEVASSHIGHADTVRFFQTSG
ncbi:MAG: hypothetical protein ACLQVF_19460 [Isosphaeraceae bacterium]